MPRLRALPERWLCELLRVNSGSNPVNVDTSFIAQTGLSVALAGTVGDELALGDAVGLHPLADEVEDGALGVGQAHVTNISHNRV